MHIQTTISHYYILVVGVRTCKNKRIKMMYIKLPALIKLLSVAYILLASLIPLPLPLLNTRHDITYTTNTVKLSTNKLN